MSSAGDDRKHGAYGRRLAENFSLDAAPNIVTRSLQGAHVAVTEVSVSPLARLSDPLPREEAFAMSLVLRDLPDHRYWEDGNMAPARLIRTGEMMLHDLRRGPQTLVDKPLHSLLFYVPRQALYALAAEANVPKIDELRYEPGAGLADDVVRAMGMSLLPAVRAPEQASRLFVDHLTLAIVAHLAHTYGGLETIPRPVPSGLAVWQERRAKEMLAADLAGDTALSEIAQACGLSVSHFARAFRNSTGLAPHAWLQRHRVETAKAMLRERRESLSFIALACGFANQSHFTRVFSKRAGLSPGAWRRRLSD